MQQYILASTVHKPDDWLLQCLQNGSLRLHSIGSDSRTFIGRDYYPHLGKTLSDQDPLLGGLIFFPGLEFGGFSFFPFASLCWYGSRNNTAMLVFVDDVLSYYSLQDPSLMD